MCKKTLYPSDLLYYYMDLLKILFPEPIPSLHNRPITYDMRYLPDHSRKPVIIFIHGFKGFKDWGYFNQMADIFAKAGFVFIKLNLSHNGTSPDHLTEFADMEAFGNNNYSVELDDVGAIIDYVKATDFSLPDIEFDRERIFLIGHSRGGSLALLKAYEDPRVKAVVTMAAVTDFGQRWSDAYLHEWKEKGVQYIQNTRTGQTMPMYYQMVEDFYRHKDRLDLPKAIQKLSTPLLAFHGLADETVPVHMARNIGKWNSNARIEVLPGANHTFGGQHPYHDKTLPEDVNFITDKSIAFFKSI